MFFDPAFATGYEFALRPTDAPIVSVELPDLGDGLYDIHIRDAAGDLVLLQENAPAETRIDLGQAVRWLFIDGLEESAEVPLGDQAAFVTGLYFDEPGTVNLTMQPIPEPATMSLLAVGGLGLLGKRRNR